MWKMIYVFLSLIIALLVMIKDHISAIVLCMLVCFLLGMDVSKCAYEQQKEQLLKTIERYKEVSEYYQELAKKKDERKIN